jgi:isoprenylcysteine carboxyl methyltransferase (ICMT) family protein YpbQ
MLFLLAVLQKAAGLSSSTQGHRMDMPNSILFYLVLIISSVIVAAVIIWTIKLLFWPGEKSRDHIKYKILEE